MFQDTRPAELGPDSGLDAWAEFRVTQPQERQRLLRALCDGQVPVNLNAPDGTALTVTLWAVDVAQGRINFSAEPGLPQLARLLDADEAVAVAYLESIKLQFDVQGFLLVRGSKSNALQCALPREIYRFQRRNAYRVRPRSAHEPLAQLRHPSLPEMRLQLRVLDVSIGGCALWLPHDVPPLQAGTRVGEMLVELDAETRFTAAMTLQHVSSQGQGEGGGGVRLGCEWHQLPSAAERMLQRWIDRMQQRRRLLALD
jgi:flagellar brake protein